LIEPRITCGPLLGFRLIEMPSTAGTARRRASSEKRGISPARKTSVRCCRRESLPQRRSRWRKERGMLRAVFNSSRICRVVSSNRGISTPHFGASTISRVPARK